MEDIAVAPAPLAWGRRYLMCPPQHFRVEYAINPWMDVHATLDRDLAIAQWDTLAATLEAARTLLPRRLIAVFQPHLYSRTVRQAAEFGAALAAADEVVVLDVYPARERAQDYPGVSGLLVAQAAADAAEGRPVAWLRTLAEARALLVPRLHEGDLVLTLGAGDVDSLGRALVTGS